MKQAKLPQGTIEYRDSGSGEPIVFVHGLLSNGELWRDVAPLLAADHRVIVPDWPLGSQRLALDPSADLSPPGLARLIGDFLAELDLQDVTLVGNDTGGALCQILISEQPERIARLVLTPCDAYEHFPPPMLRPLQEAARAPGGMTVIAQSMRSALARRSPAAYGGLMKRADDALTAAWTRPALEDATVRAQARTILLGMAKKHTLAAAKSFAGFQKPVLILWAREDRMFKLSDGERLAADFPDARLEVLEDSYTFVSLDQPVLTAEAIGAFIREPRTAVAERLGA